MNQTVSRETWLEARAILLAEEKRLTRERDALNEKRRALPWVRIDKPYVFDGPQGRATLADLFAGRSQLIVQHFMLGPGWKEGCVGCSFGADHVGGALVHLEHHDVTFVAVSRAPLAEIEAFKRRMGLPFTWVSSHGSDFNYDFNVSFTPEQVAGGGGTYNYRTGPVWTEEMPGMSVFAKDAAGQVFHTYSAFGRGDEMAIGTYMLLDMTPKGRNETGPNFNLTDWVRHHDRYDAGGTVDTTGRYRPGDGKAACCSATGDAA